MMKHMKQYWQSMEQYKDKSVSVMWSGGLDSNFLIYSLLKVGANVTAHSFSSTQLPAAPAEKAARKALAEMFETYRPNHFISREYTPSIPLGSGSLFGQARFWTGVMGLVADIDETDYVMLGYIMGDDAISYLDEIKAEWDAKAWNASNSDWPELVTPLVKITKSDIANELADCHIMSLYYLNWCCERPEIVRDVDVYQECGRCTSCKRAAFSLGDHYDRMRINLTNFNAVTAYELMHPSLTFTKGLNKIEIDDGSKEESPSVQSDISLIEDRPDTHEVHSEIDVGDQSELVQEVHCEDEAQPVSDRSELHSSRKRTTRRRT